jgi:hypothetical protein
MSNNREIRDILDHLKSIDNEDELLADEVMTEPEQKNEINTKYRRVYKRTGSAVILKIAGENEPQYFDSIQDMAKRLNLSKAGIYSSLEDGHCRHFSIKCNKSGICHKFEYVLRLPSIYDGVSINEYKDNFIKFHMMFLKSEKKEAEAAFIKSMIDKCIF